MPAIAGSDLFSVILAETPNIFAARLTKLLRSVGTPAAIGPTTVKLVSRAFSTDKRSPTSVSITNESN
jgi:hypothetical protein